MLLRITFLLALSSFSLLATEDKLEWKALPDLPSDLGVAGPFAGVHNDALHPLTRPSLECMWKGMGRGFTGIVWILGSDRTNKKV